MSDDMTDTFDVEQAERDGKVLARDYKADNMCEAQVVTFTIDEDGKYNAGVVDLPGGERVLRWVGGLENLPIPAPSKPDEHVVAQDGERLVSADVDLVELLDEYAAERDAARAEVERLKVEVKDAGRVATDCHDHAEQAIKDMKRTQGERDAARAGVKLWLRSFEQQRDQLNTLRREVWGLYCQGFNSSSLTVKAELLSKIGRLCICQPDAEKDGRDMTREEAQQELNDLYLASVAGIDLTEHQKQQHADLLKLCERSSRAGVSIRWHRHKCWIEQAANGPLWNDEWGGNARYYTTQAAALAALPAALDALEGGE